MPTIAKASSTPPDQRNERFGSAGFLEANSPAVDISGRHGSHNHEPDPLPTTVGRDEPGEGKTLRRGEDPSLWEQPQTKQRFQRAVAGLVDHDFGNNRNDNTPEHDLHKQRDVADRFDVNRRQLVDKPVVGKPAYADDDPENCGGKDPRNRDPEHVGDANQQRLEAALRERGEALSNLEPNRTRHEVPGHGQVLLGQVGDGKSAKEPEDGHDPNQERNLKDPLEDGDIAIERRARWALNSCRHGLSFRRN